MSSGDRTYFSGEARRRRYRALRWTTSIAVLTTAALAGGDARDARGARASADSVMVAGGEVALDSAAPLSIRWLTDSNIVALIDSMQRPAIAAARYQLQSWASDSTVNLALLLARDHVAMLGSIDSLAAVRRIVRRLPAMADSLLAPYPQQITQLYGLYAVDRERRFLTTQRDAHTRAIADLTAIESLARDPDLRALIARATQLEREHLARIPLSAPAPRARAREASAPDTTNQR